MTRLSPRIPLRRALVAASLVAVTGSIITLNDGGVPAAYAAAKRAKAPSHTHTAVIELQDHGAKGAPRVSRYRVAVSDEGQTSRLIHDDGDTRTVVAVTWVRKAGAAPLIRLEVERVERLGPRGKMRRMEIHSSGRITPGKGELFGRFNRPGGGRLDVRLKLV